ncbi:MAG: mandelate racemase/muconate lactonizing enzyme family protein [Rhodobacteraceae bacterium]|nr:mandelate racemase/muconate lactonizing enzyme family protein [Paracoccaceae bacterium]
MSDQICIDRVQLFALSCEVECRPNSSLGVMRGRNGLLLAISDKDGGIGWGEVWCNFPPRHALAMALLIEDVIAPHLLSQKFTDWSAIRPYLENSLARMILHTGQPGSFAHCLAGIDMAAADLVARRRQIPLHQMLTAQIDHNQLISVYASSPSGADLESDLATIINDHHSSVKLKIGFGESRDSKILAIFDQVSKGQLDLYVDANQAWTLSEAIEATKRLETWSPVFVEEPLRADADQADWGKLAQMSRVEIAAGENIQGDANFGTFIANKSLGFVQPDVAKWGGISGTLAIALKAQENGLRYAFHFMGTALGLAATLQTCAAAGGSGPIELDANANPLRTELGDIDLSVRNGCVAVPDGHGLGFIPDAKSLTRFADTQIDIRR